MLKVTLKGIRAHKRRLASMFISVLSGVAFLAGTMMLSDTIGETFDDLFGDVFQDTDAVVRSASSVSGDFGMGDLRGRIDASLVDDVLAVDGVAAAEAFVESPATLVGADGDRIGNPDMGAPTLAADWGEVDELNPFHIVEGDPPSAGDEVVIDKGTADTGDLEVGDRMIVIPTSGVIEATVVGIARFGNADSPGGAGFAMFTQEAAERLLGEPGQVNTIGVVAEEGVSQEEVRDRIAAAMPDGIEVLTGEEITEETQDDIGELVSFFTIFLSVFAGIALVVSVFSIYNTFSIIVAQRLRELAVLRAVGASRGQVLGSVLGEAIFIGVVASAIGLAGGVVVTGMLKGVLSSFGIDIPAGGVVINTRTIVVSLVVGVLVTLLSAIGPAVRASRVAPLAALREVAIERTRRVPVRLILGIVITALGVFAALGAITGEGGTDALFNAAGGVLLVLVGVIILGPILARPLGRGIGWPLARMRGVTGRLARENAARNPKRTANTAAALLIGVGVVGFFTVMASSIRSSVDQLLNVAVSGDIVVDSGSFGFGGFGEELAGQVDALPEVESAAGISFTTVDVDGDNEFVTAVDAAAFAEVVDIEVSEGTLADLGANGIAVYRETAENEGLAVGETVQVRFPQTGVHEFQVVALYERPELAGNWVIGREAYNANVIDRFVTQIFVELAPGVTVDDGVAAIEEAAAAYPQAEVQTASAFSESQASQVNQLLGLIYAMLGFAIIIAFMGIANTLSLSVFERTRELGLLRAVGMTRGQLRSSVRWESAIIAVLGAAIGLIIGVVFSWVTITAADEPFLAFNLPVVQVVIVVVLAALAGIGAAVHPAWRASKLDVLEAIATE